MLSENQLGYLCYALRPFQSQLPSRYEDGANMIWLDFEEWVSTIDVHDVSRVIGLFKDGREEDAFDALVDLGMPVKRD